MMGELLHAEYPHEPGRLYGCAACDASCHCSPGTTRCVHCAELVGGEA